MNTTTSPASSSAVTQSELNQIGESIKASLEYHSAQLFSNAEHYLVEIHTDEEATAAWAGETIDQGSQCVNEPIRMVYRMLSGVVQKQQKKLFPWTTFCFKPASVAVDGGNEPTSFLNLQAMRSVSRRLWAMVFVYHDPKGKRPPELCCYVDRHIPALDVVIEPQIRIPLRNTLKLAVDERNGVALPSALFSDNPNLNKPLQVSPQCVDLSSGEEPLTFALTNTYSEPVTLCEIVLCDYDEEEVEINEYLEIEGLDEGSIIEPGTSIQITLNPQVQDLVNLSSLIIGYAIGSADDLDEDEEELMTEEELTVPLQGEDTRTFHISLIQGQTYENLKRALLTPEAYLENLGEDLADKTLIREDFFLQDDAEVESSASLLLNAADLDGGGLGTLTLAIKSARPLEDFEGLLHEDQDVEADLSSDHFTFRDQCVVPTSLVYKKQRGRKLASAAELSSVILEPIYLGKLSLYNELTTLDYGQARRFILNCVAIAALLRSLNREQEAHETTDDLSIII